MNSILFLYLFAKCKSKMSFEGLLIHFRSNIEHLYFSSANQCPNRYFENQNGLCQHSYSPLNVLTIIGLFATVFSAGATSLAGTGGGVPHFLIILSLYGYTPKDATMMVFCAMIGTTLGNFLCKFNRNINSQPMLKYQYAIVPIPIIFMASIVAVFMNKFFPSLFILTLMLITGLLALKSTYQKFKATYDRQSLQNQQRDITNQNVQICVVNGSQQENNQLFNPFQVKRYRIVFIFFLSIFLVFSILDFLKGNQKINSLIGVNRCSISYWILYLLQFSAMGVFCWWSWKTFRNWIFDDYLQKDKLKLQQNLQTFVQNYSKNMKYLVQTSILAGLFQGFGLGGGFFLIPMYKQFGLNSIQATSTSAYCLLVTTIINCMQAMFMGVVYWNDFLVLFSLSFIGSYLSCYFITNWLQRKNRTSILQAILLFNLVMALIVIPLSVYLKYRQSGYNSEILLGFGNLC